MVKKREMKAEDKQVKKVEKKVIDFLLEGEKKIAGKSNCLQA